MFHAHRWIFGLHLGEHFVHATFIAAARRTNRQAVHGAWEVDGTHAYAAVERITMDDGAVIDFIDFGNGTNVAGAEEISFLSVLALENEWPRRFDSTLIVINVNDIVLLECALMHTEDADFANKGVVDDFEDLSNERQNSCLG